MKNQILWSVFFIVPLMFILSVILPDIVGAVLVLVGMLAAVIVLIADIIDKKVFTKVQVFKLFCDSLLFIKFGLLYEHEAVTVMASVVAILCAFVLVIFFSCKMNEITEEAREIGSDK